MKIKELNLFEKVAYRLYKLFGLTFLNFVLCLLTGLTVNTYTGGNQNSVLDAALIYFLIAIILNLAYLFLQGKINNIVNKTIIDNPNLAATERFTSFEGIERHAITFEDQYKWWIIVLSLSLIVPVGMALFNFHKGNALSNPADEKKTTLLTSKLDSIIAVSKIEEKQIVELKTLIAIKLPPNSSVPAKNRRHSGKFKKR